jgi:acyl transferase domain-containing protein/NAD(P)-dependent dehydrogenase (short-subunit alcohol dehydrogenase family)/acyl carrier protein
METAERAVAIVGVGAILPDAMTASAFWENLLNKRYSITETPPERWCVEDYYDPDPNAPDKTYTKIGGWVRGFQFDWKKYRIPPKVAAAMDQGQQWAVTIADQALADYGYPARPLDTERTGVILGTAMGGELHYLTTLRINFPEFRRALETVREFRELPSELRRTILENWHTVIDHVIPPVTEDSMPGELPNIVSGRVANVLNLRGLNFITDAACASSLAALDAACELLAEHRVDAVISGGVDRNMGASTFVKFCKIGALSATGTRPFGKGADGFVMGEGAAAFLLKRLEDAERAGDKIYAVIRGVGGASDGKGKGITAPNPIGQQLAIRRAWENAGLDPATATLIEAHGTSTRVGDVVEVESLATVFDGARNSIGLGSVKSNLGHLKAGAGAAGLLKATMALHHRILPPTLNCVRPNPDIDFSRTPFYLLHEAREWPAASAAMTNGTPRRCGVSAYGFGGTNFHVVLEEHVPGRLTEKKKMVASLQVEGSKVETPLATLEPSNLEPASLKPLRGILALGADTPHGLADRLDKAIRRVQDGWTPPFELPSREELQARERLVVDFGAREELLDRLQKARKALDLDTPPAWRAAQQQGIFRGSGAKPGKVVFLFPGQGSQYLNMGRELAARSPTVAQVLADADRVMTPILGKPLTQYVFFERQASNEIKRAEKELTQTAICQPAMLTLDVAIYRLLAEYGFKPDMVMGHSLGEYAALIVSGILPFDEALEAAAARGREMSELKVPDPGWMAAVMVPSAVVEQTLKEIDGYVVAANINSHNQSVIGGASQAVEQAIAVFKQKGFEAQRIPVSHAFHTQIVAPASVPLRLVLDRLHIAEPQLPLVGNINGEFYPPDPTAIKEILQQQVASPVQWVKGLETLYTAGARTFVEVGPKKALKGFVDDVLGDKAEVVSLFTNHPKLGELPTFNQALCGLYAAGYGVDERRTAEDGGPKSVVGRPSAVFQSEVKEMAQVKTASGNGSGVASLESVAEMLQKLVAGQPSSVVRPFDRNAPPLGSIVISGTGLGLPGAEKAVMDPDNALRILRGEQFVDLIPERFRKKMLDKRITRVVKSEDGSGHLETLTDPSEVIKLAGRPGSFNLTEEYGVPEKLVEALDITYQLAMAAGLDALHEAGIPLVQTFKRATTGKYLPDRWLLPEALRDETGVIFASAFPGADRFADELTRYYKWQNRLDQVKLLQDLCQRTTDPNTVREINHRLAELQEQLEREPYEFDRRFLFRIVAFGHTQFAEYIGARGPNTQVNAACASTAQAIAIAEDWIRSGRCRRVVVISADNVTGDNLLEWAASGFLAVGAAATDDRVQDAVLPFDRRRHGMIIGMGACSLVVESEDVVRERGMRGLVELLSSETLNSAYHGTRLDVNHIPMVMNSLVSAAERRFGLDRYSIASQLVFMSHETYTPARGGSASAEIAALRHTFGAAANEVVITNTKGFTGHAMGAGVEDVIAVKILEHGIVPPVPNLKEPDPELGPLNLSRGGRYPVQFALHLAAGFGSQIAMTLTRRIPGALDRVDNKLLYQRWLAEVSGYDRAETEVVKRVLRVKAQGAPPRAAAPSTWQPGTGPTVRTLEAPTVAPGPTLRGAPPAWVMPPAKPEPALTVEPLPVVPVARAPENGKAQAELKPRKEERATTKDEGRELDVQPPPSAVHPPSAMADPIAEKVLSLVAAKTGYPREMLDLDLDLEADLGIDTVKQAETFAAIREAFDITRQENLRLRDYPTLNHVIQFVRTMRPDLAMPTEGEGLKTEAQTTSEAPIVPSDGVRPPSNASDSIKDKVLEIVAAKTGYPTEMLDLDLDLEADLGVDTVKQAETFAAIREAFDIPRQENLKLRDYPTLAHVIRFVHENAKRDTEIGRQGEGESDRSVAPSPSLHVTASSIEEANRIPRRVPVPVLRPPLDLCKPTGITLDAKSRVVVMLDAGGEGQALVEKLQARGVTTLIAEPTVTGGALDAQIKAWLAEGSIQGVYWLPALEVEPDLEELNLEQWRELNRARVKNLYATMRALYESAQFLVTATRLGGLHGYGEQGATAPLGGAVVGFAKAFKRERTAALVKAVDFGEAFDANALIAETLNDPGAVEVGYSDGARFSIALEERSAANGEPGMTLDANTVFVVTGAAGGITSAIVTDLAAASAQAASSEDGGVFYLLDLVPPPDRNDPYIVLFRQSKEALKQQLIEGAKAKGERPTPVQIDKQLFAVERGEAALRAIQAVEAAGGKAFYRSVNLLDGAAVGAVMDEIRQAYGRIDVIVHAGGMEMSRALPDKDAKQFDLVFDVKADGFFNILRSAKGMPLGATVAFSSVAGRFGNSGQTDYSAANDLLCKVTSSLRRWRPETRGIVIDWTAWGGIGMATRGSIPKIMEQAGIDVLPPECGVPTVRRELTAGNFRGELVVAGRLGILTQEWDETGGLDVGKANAWLAANKFLMFGQVTGAKLYTGIEVETTLDPQVQPFLYDHAMEGVPLLPGVMGLETFAELASALAPGYRVAAVENVEYQRPLKFHRMQPQTLYLNAVVESTHDGGLTAHTVLKSLTTFPRGEMPPQEKIHFTANVQLMRDGSEKPTLTLNPSPLKRQSLNAAAGPRSEAEGMKGGEGIEKDEIYRVFFHGPTYQVLERVQLDGVNAFGLFAEGLPPNTNPSDAAALMAPRLIELCYQTAGIWEYKCRGALALPLALESVRVYRQPAEAHGKRLYAWVEAIKDGSAFDAQVVDESGAVYVELTGYRTVTLTRS